MRFTDIPIALTYDDVLLVPQRSRIESRSMVDTSAQLTPNIRLAMPVVAANMDTVTEARMAIAMARVGGLGIIHRFLTIEEQAAQVAQVKRSESFVIEEPWTTTPSEPLARVVLELGERGVNGLPVVDAAGVLVGLVTRRDLVARGVVGTAGDAMTPREELVVGTSATTLEEARTLMSERRVEKLPLVDGEGKLAGLITMKDIEHVERNPEATKDARGRLRVGAAIGVRGDYLDRAKACADAGADLLCLDIAHGHSELALSAVGELRRSVDVEIIAGNVATPEGARDLIAAGAHAIKVGVGPGSVCTTRLVAGVGVPQLTAVMECAAVCHDAGVPMCADGGIRMPADVAKAIAAGADTVMVGNLLAATNESPGSLLKRDGRMLKVHRGMASRGGMDRRDEAERAQAGEEQGPVREVVRIQQSVSDGASSEAHEFGRTVPEGVEAVVAYRGHAYDMVRELVGGLRSAMSYSNSASISEYHDRAQFVRITQAGQVESHPHDVEV